MDKKNAVDKFSEVNTLEFQLEYTNQPDIHAPENWPITADERIVTNENRPITTGDRKSHKWTD